MTTTESLDEALEAAELEFLKTNVASVVAHRDRRLFVVFTLNAPDGRASDGRADGRASDGRASDGRASDGRASDGRASDGRTDGRPGDADRGSA